MVCCIETKLENLTPYEIHRRECIYNVIAGALVVIGLAGTLWGIVSISQQYSLAHSITLLSLGPVVTIMGIVLYTLSQDKYGKETISISRSYQEYRNHSNDTQRFNTERKMDSERSERHSKIGRNINRSSSDSDSSSEEKVDKVAKKEFDSYPWNDDPATLSDSVACDRMRKLESEPEYYFQDKKGDRWFGPDARQRLTLLKQAKDNEIEYEERRKEWDSMVREAIQENNRGCTIL